MKTAELELVTQEERSSKARSSRSGSFGRAISQIEPGQLSQSDLAYLRFILLALHSSMKEVRHSVGNRALITDVCIGIDLLIENAERRFGFPLISPENRVKPTTHRQHLASQFNLEAPPDAGGSGCSPELETSLNDPSTRHEHRPAA